MPADAQPPSRRPSGRALLVVAGLLLAAAIAGALPLALAVRGEAARLRSPGENGRTVEAERDWLRSLLAARRPLLAEDRARLAALAPLAQAGASRDAGPLLNPLLEWPVPWPDRPRAPLALPPDVAAQLADFSTEKVAALARIDLARIDLAWMARLADYDHWDLERNSPWDDVAPGEVAAQDDRDPYLERLTPWVKLRLMKGLAEEDPAAALDETRQLERLLFSTETLLGAVEALVIAQLERQAYVAALAHDPASVQGFRPLGDGELARQAIRAVRALPVLLGPEADAGDMADLAARRDPGFCAALREGARQALWLRPLLEEGHRDYYARLDILVDGSSCRLTALRRAPRHPGLPARLRIAARIGDGAGYLAPDEPDAPLARRLALLASPSLRALVGEKLALGAATAALVTN